jgi:hypothetical protein
MERIGFADKKALSTEGKEQGTGCMDVGHEDTLNSASDVHDDGCRSNGCEEICCDVSDDTCGYPSVKGYTTTDDGDSGFDEESDLSDETETAYGGESGGMADAGQFGGNQRSDRGSPTTNRVRLSSQIQCAGDMDQTTAEDQNSTEDQFGDTSILWSYLGRIYETRQGIGQIEYDGLL